MSEILYTVKDVAEQTGISAHTLRFYDKEGLLPFVKKSASGTRLFSEEDFDSLYTITTLKRSGMPLKKIREFMELYVKGAETLPQRQQMFEEQRQVILDRIEELKEMLDVVEYKCWYFEEAQRRQDPDFYKKVPVEEMPEQFQKFCDKVKQFRSYEEDAACEE